MRAVLPILFVTLIVSLSPVRAFAQQANNPPFDFPSHGVEPPERDWYRDMVRSTASSGQTHRASEPRVLKKGPLAPSNEDRTAYASFLAQSHTGLIRLLPRQIPQSKNPDVKINGGGAYYSFAFLTHEYGFGSDLELAATFRYMDRSRLPAWYQFSVGFAGADYGMMTTVDDVALEDITTNDPQVRFLLAYRPPRAEPAARCEAQAFRQGRLIDLQLYQSRLPIRTDTTYLLRSINYGESDVAVAFRVVRQDTDASVTIAWKLLKKFDPVKLENVVYLKPTDKCPIK